MTSFLGIIVRPNVGSRWSKPWLINRSTLFVELAQAPDDFDREFQCIYENGICLAEKAALDQKAADAAKLLADKAALDALTPPVSAPGAAAPIPVAPPASPGAPESPAPTAPTAAPGGPTNITPAPALPRPPNLPPASSVS